MRFATLIRLASAVSLLACGRLLAATDLWDVTNGTIVTADSGTTDFYNPHSVNLGNMFTQKPNPLAVSYDDVNNTLFSDAKPAGFVHSVEWQTPSPVTLGSFELYAREGGPGFVRSFDHFTLFAWNGASFDPIFDTGTTHPYAYIDPSTGLLYGADVTPVTTNRFRAQFVQNGAMVDAYLGFTTYGPRILELAGYAPVPEPGSLAVLIIGSAAILRRNRRTQSARLTLSTPRRLPTI